MLTRKTGVPLFIVLLAVLCAAEVLVVTSPLFLQNIPLLALVITADLLLGIPLLFYGFVVRPFRLSPLTLAPVFLVSVVLAGYILPPNGRTYLNSAKILVPLVEMAIFSVVLWKGRSLYRHFREAKHQEPFFIDALFRSVRASFGTYPAVNILAMECSLIFLALFGWFFSFTARDPRDKVFTYHRKSLYPALFMVFLFLMILETVALHLLIQQWSPLVAWILTALSVYSAFWLVGDWNAIRLHPIVLTDDLLHLRSGLRWSATLSVRDIASMQQPSQKDEKARDYLSFALAGPPQLVIVLKQPVQVQGLFGIEKTVSRVGLFLDDVDTFRAELNGRKQTS